MDDSGTIFCSVIIPTIGRATLIKAVDSIRQQTFDATAVEIIVVNDSGKPLSHDIMDQLHHVAVIDTNRRERSFARNTGAATACGEYLCFLDDDDWLLPDALDQFWSLRQRVGPAAWMYGGIQVVDEHESILAEINSELHGNCAAQILGGAWAPIQTSLINADVFFKVGGYDPAICGTEDEDLCRRIALVGDFANTGTSVACLFRGSSWDTSTNYLRAPADTRMSRDRILNENGSLARIAASLRSRPDRSYWCGRVLKVAISAVAMNLRHGSPARTLSRLVFALRWLGVTRLDIFSEAFWNAFFADHARDTLHFVQMKLEQPGPSMQSSR